MKKVFLIVKSLIKQFILKIKFGKSIVFKTKHNLFERNVKIICRGKGSTVTFGGVRFGDRCLLSANGGGYIAIGKSVSINSNAIIVSKGGITIDDGCSIAPNVCIYDHDHYFNENGFVKGEFKISPIHIGKNVWIGAGAIILRGSIIGDNCIIGAGTVVHGNIPDNSIVKNDRSMIVENLHK